VIFDAHVYPIDVRGGLQLASAAGVAELMSQEGLDRVLLVSEDGEALRRSVEEIDGAYAMLWVDPRARDAADRARELLAHAKFRGLKLNPAVDPVEPDDPLVHPLLELAGELGVPVAFHCGHPPASLYTLPWMIEKAAIRFPEVQFVLVHMGYCVFPYHDGAMDIAQELPNVHLDVSGMPHTWRVKEAVERVGADRVLYGSSAPWHHPRLELLKIRLSNLLPEQTDSVLGGNAAALYLPAAGEAEGER
jgi:hypothetical protein